MLESVPHLPFRLVVFLAPLFLLNRAIQMADLPGLSYNLWGIPDVSPVLTFGILLSVSLLTTLLFTKYYVLASTLIAVLLYLHVQVNPYFYWAWAQMTPILIAVRIGTLKIKSPGWKKTFHHIFMFYVTAIYLVPCLDRFLYHDWFTGKIVAILLASQHFARFPVLIQDYSFFAPLSNLVQFSELLGPFIFILFPPARKSIAFMFIAFHLSFMIVSDIEMWHPFMAFLWWDLMDDSPEDTMIARIAVFAGVIAVAPFSILAPAKMHSAYMEPGIVRFLSEQRIIPFSKMRMFTQDETFLKKTNMTYLNGKEKFQIIQSLQPYFLRRYFGFNAGNPVPINGLCRNPGDNLGLYYEADGLKETFHEKQVITCL